MALAPTKVTLFSYQVGFGDCFLLRFHYPDRDRHALIDFGSTGKPKHAEKDHMAKVARDIAARCGGRLEVVVATHRHADHISGFATDPDGDGPGDIIAGLAIDYVVQPWTEAPDAAKDSIGPEISSPQAFTSRRMALAAMHETSRHALAMLDDGSLHRVPKAIREELEFIGRDNLSNLSAVENLMRLGRRRFYAWHGMDLPLHRVLPGVKTHVLGPPTLRQTDTIRKQRSEDEDEFWHLAPLRLSGARAAVAEGEALFPGHPTEPGNRLAAQWRWFANRVEQVQAEQVLSLVRALDKQMNNTSLILLFEVGGKSLLFPGDAQIENWRYALQSPMAEKLTAVDLYKVGHHGSLNATPRSLWARFAKRGPSTKKGRLTTVMSTMPGKHGKEERGTEVPRATLLRALETDSELHSTHRAPEGQLFQEVTLKLGG